jgi:hypothetical protein
MIPWKSWLRYGRCKNSVLKSSEVLLFWVESKPPYLCSRGFSFLDPEECGRTYQKAKQ